MSGTISWCQNHSLHQSVTVTESISESEPQIHMTPVCINVFYWITGGAVTRSMILKYDLSEKNPANT